MLKIIIFEFGSQIEPLGNDTRILLHFQVLSPRGSQNSVKWYTEIFSLRGWEISWYWVTIPRNCSISEYHYPEIFIFQVTIPENLPIYNLWVTNTRKLTKRKKYCVNYRVTVSGDFQLLAIVTWILRNLQATKPRDFWISGYCYLEIALKKHRFHEHAFDLSFN